MYGTFRAPQLFSGIVFLLILAADQAAAAIGSLA
jgi:hypothetical protein